MDSHLYQVVMTGRLVPGFAREAALAGLARIFETSAARFKPTLDGRECRIDDRLPAEQAAALQRRLESIGVEARIDPANSTQTQSPSGVTLPNRLDSSDPGLMRCPACGHQQLVAKRCDECGIVFADYNRTRAASTIGAPPRAPASAPKRRSPRRASGIHDSAQAKWAEEWLDDGLPTEQVHMKLFIGPHAPQLFDVCQRMMLGRRTRMMLTWAGGAVISPFLWAMYRKMWGWGAVIFLVEILLPVVLITLGSKQGMPGRLVDVGLILLVVNRSIWPAILKSLYCRHVRRTIMQMNRMSPTFASDVQVANRGGTSRTSLLVGVVLAMVVSLLAWSVIDTLHAQWLAAARAAAPAPIVVPPPSVPSPGEPPVESPAALQNQALVEENKWVATRNRLRQLGQRLSVWFAEGGSGRDPSGLDLQAIAAAVPLAEGETVDGWGVPLLYQSDGRGFQLLSAGPDGQFGSPDDVEYRRILEP